MVVIAVIGIVGVMIVPEMKGSYQDALLRAACRELVDTFQLAYSRAVSLNVDHRVRIDEGSSRYVIEVSDPRSAARPEFHALKGFAGCEGKLDRRVSVRLRYPTGETPDEAAAPGQSLERNSNFDGVFFYADGTATACQVVLTDQHGFSLALAVSPVTGRVRIGEVHRR